MDCLFGLVGDGFALVVADSSAVQSIIRQKTDEDKVMILDSHKLLGQSGATGDRVQFAEYIQKNMSLYRYRNSLSLSTKAAANFTRSELARALRSSGAYQTNVLIAGYDEGEGPSLYYLDYISTLHKVDKVAMGYGGYFMLSIMDKHYKKDLSLPEALELVSLCIKEVQARLVVGPPNFVIKIVDKDGARLLEWRKTVADEGAPSTEGDGAAAEGHVPVAVEAQ
jgi:20S proteasome subunit beta 4